MFVWRGRIDFADQLLTRLGNLGLTNRITPEMYVLVSITGIGSFADSLGKKEKENQMSADSWPN